MEERRIWNAGTSGRLGHVPLLKPPPPALAFEGPGWQWGLPFQGSMSPGTLGIRNEAGDRFRLCFAPVLLESETLPELNRMRKNK
jgi:hypothetical protein